MSDSLQYLIVIEKSSKRYGAYVPDLPSCVAIGVSRAEVIELIRESIENHLKDLRERGEAIPQPSTSSETIAVKAAYC